MSLHRELKECLELSVSQLKLTEIPYFNKLCSGEMSKRVFLNSQIEFAPLVHAFSRSLALVIANIPDALNRISLVENLWEEHGRGVKANVHGQTILALIDRLGGMSSDIDMNKPSVNARIFNEALRSVSSFEDYRFSASVFAGMERTFVDVSTMTYQSIVDCGWLEESRIIHYELHRELDIQHSEEFLLVVNKDWKDSEASRALIEGGIRFGSRLFANFYVGLSNSVK